MCSLYPKALKLLRQVSSFSKLEKDLSFHNPSSNIESPQKYINHEFELFEMDIFIDDVFFFFFNR